MSVLQSTSVAVGGCWTGGARDREDKPSPPPRRDEHARSSTRRRAATAPGGPTVFFHCAGCVFGAAAIRAGAGRCAGASTCTLCSLEAGPGPAQRRAVPMDSTRTRPCRRRGSGRQRRQWRWYQHQRRRRQHYLFAFEDNSAPDGTPSDATLLPSLMPTDETIAAPPWMCVYRSFNIRINGYASDGPKIRMKYEKDTPTTETDDGT